MRRVLAALPLAAALTVALAGCGSTSKPVSVAESSGAAAGAGSSKAADSAKVGQEVTYDSGLKVAVSVPKPTKISDMAAGGEGIGTMVVFSVTLTNGTKETYDPALSRVSVAYGSEGVQADQVFDSANKVGDSFSTKILPGKKATARYGFAVPAKDQGDLVIEVTPGFLDSAATLFTGSASK